MAGTNNRQVIEDAFKQFSQQIDEEVFNMLDDACRNLLLDAVIRNRMIGDMKKSTPHQFTGNLINSIVVILFRKSTGEVCKYFASDQLKAPIQREMSRLNARGKERKYHYHFRPDWQNTPESEYMPEVATDRSTGPQDARSFAAEWGPSLNTAFEICVAYTSEYAEWVHTQRKTVGILNSMHYTSKMMKGKGFKPVPVSFLRLNS